MLGMTNNLGLYKRYTTSMPSRERNKLTDIKISQDQCRIQLFAGEKK
jgi:hypothetical protein